MTDQTPRSEIILYQTEDGQTRIECRFENETIWLTQSLIAELFQVTVPTVKPVAASKSSCRIGRPSWTNFFASMIGAFCQIPVKYPVS